MSGAYVCCLRCVAVVEVLPFLLLYFYQVRRAIEEMGLVLKHLLTVDTVISQMPRGTSISGDVPDLLDAETRLVNIIFAIFHLSIISIYFVGTIGQCRLLLERVRLGWNFQSS